VLVLALAPAALGAARPAPELTPGPTDGLTRALARGSVTDAQYALQRARSIFEPAAVRARFGQVAPARDLDATFVLRDLVARYAELSPAEQRIARAILSRPDDTDNPNEAGGHYDQGVVNSDDYVYRCTSSFCVNWVKTSSDSATPAFVDDVFASMETVWATEIGRLGYRRPKDDSTSTATNPLNANGLIDIYVKDLPNGLYGYCTTDDPTAFGPGAPNYDVSAYCVIDNDYSPSEFPGAANGLAALQVTVAHEFFHAVQFAYNFFQDRWLLESTAVWMEDEVFDDVNDNYQYLLSSALTDPGVPLDTTTFEGDLDSFKYGGWLFFRHVSETLDAAVIRRAIEIGGAPDLLRSIHAVDRALKQRNSSFVGAFTGFGAWNVIPSFFYEEGGGYQHGGKPLQAPVGPAITLSTAKRDTGWRKRTLSHLTTGYGYLVPGAGVKAGARVKITLDLPRRSGGSAASLVLQSGGGATSTRRVTLNVRGDATLTVPLGSFVVVVLSNANLQLAACNQGKPYTCGGSYRHDPDPYWFRAKLVQ
jgi:hypothetical protein